MALIKPFCAVRPTSALADKVAALPYDVMSSKEARSLAADNPYSFLHIDKAEIDLPTDTCPYDEIVYHTAHDNLQRMIKDGIFIHEEKPCFYIYRQIMDGRTQVGVVACSSIDDYLNNVIKKHELTRADKEEDRYHHVDICGAQTGPIFITYQARSGINEITNATMLTDPLYDFTFNGVQQTVWRIDNSRDIQTLINEFAAVGNTYIADGHHRTASAVRVGIARRQQMKHYSGTEEFNFFLSVLFPDDQLCIMDYNRVIHDLNGLNKEEFFRMIDANFTVEPLPYALHPQQKHSFSMYLDHSWYLLTARSGSFDAQNPVAQLDVSILQNNLLNPVLGIGDPRTDNRIEFVGGIRGLNELERRADASGGIAFAMFATTLDDMMSIANAGAIMPPKSTWFEPKLLSGLFIHEIG